ncbi:nucleotidyltransferase family protein [Pseudactinotalea terrae]|uniref:nucleotidyltransferase family protein n=1 Tax=Pseudactinotalea terrae TaxID=1743262 RepID=UPI00240CE59D|nr:nucleotidyltransferase family protein [Pseudactinotalea terrae]
MVAICQGAEPEPPADLDSTKDLIRAVRHHRIAPLAHVAYREVCPPLAAELRVDRDDAIGTHLRASIVLEQIRALLGDTPWVTFKGAVLSETAHPRPGLRTYHDVDVLVSPQDLREVCSVLLGHKWQIADYDDMLRNPETPGEMHWISPAGLLVDLHWSMTNTAVRRARLSVATDDILARRREVSIGLSRTWTLDEVDSLVHVGLHATLTGANRLLLLLDTDRVARNIADWGPVAQRAMEWQAEPHLSLVLSRAQRIFDTPLPPTLDTELGVSATFSRLCAVVDNLAPVPAARRDQGVARMFARAVRRGARRTAASVTRSAAIGVAERVVRPKRHRAQERTRAHAEALALYLDAVESAGRT